MRGRNARAGESAQAPASRKAFTLPASGKRAARQVDEEFEFHLKERVDELVEGGMDRAAAEAEVRRRFGDLASLRRETVAIDRRSARRAGWSDVLGDTWRDVRYALRGMRRRPGLTTAIVLTLALAIGAGTAIFSVVDAVLFRPLPVAWLSDLRVVRHDIPQLGLAQTQLGPPSVEDLLQRRDLFAAGSAYSGASFTLANDENPRRVTGARTMGDFFSVFGAAPIVGSVYGASSSEEGDHLVAVLSYALWRDAFGGDPSIVGRTVELSGTSYQVVGVMGPEFRFPRTAELWVPQVMNEGMRSVMARGRLTMTPVMRMHPHLNDEQLAAGLDDQARRWNEALSLGVGDLVLNATPMVGYLAGNLRPALLVITGAVGLLLLIACANVASLQLLRAMARSRELAVRAALGAGRRAIARQLLMESLTLAVAGGLLGVLVALALLKLLSITAAGSYGMLADVRINGGALGAAALITLGCGVLFGLAPTVRAARTDLQGVLKDTSRGSSGGPSRNRVLQGAVILQVAFSLVLLLGAGLLTTSLARTIVTDPGFRTESVHSMAVSIAGARYDTPEKRVAFFDAFLERLRGTPGVDAASVVSGLPFSGGADSSPFTLDGLDPLPDEPERHANLVVVGDGYFSAMGIPVVRGREFERTDGGDSPLVAVIDERLARDYFRGEDPLGRTIDQGRPATIVGVVGSVKHGALHEEDKATVYYSNRHNHWIPTLHVVVRSSLPEGAVVSLVRASARELDPTVPIHDVQTLGSRVSASLATERLAMGVMTGFAAFALILTLLGVYGVIGYAVTQRVPEIGIRMALGATPAMIMRMVLLGGVGLVGAGALVGLVVFVLTSGQLSGLLHHTSTRDPIPMAIGLTSVIVAAALACWVPARRAARVGPAVGMES